MTHTRLSTIGPLLCLTTAALGGSPLDPRGKVHIAIGLPNTLDTLKTFVEPEGCFSPGVGSYGVYFWLYDNDGGRLHAPGVDEPVEYGLASGLPLPWTSWRAGDVRVRTKLCQTRPLPPAFDVQIVASRAVLRNQADAERRLSLYVALRGLGPAGFAVRSMAVADEGDALMVEGHPAIVPDRKPSSIGVIGSDGIVELALAGRMPTERAAESATGDCTGAMRFDLTLRPREEATFGFVCPVLPGRRAVGHRWDGTSEWAQLDLAVPNPAEGGELQPDLGLEYYRALSVNDLFTASLGRWVSFFIRADIASPDPRWGEAFKAIAAHAALAMNEGAPDVAVVNYNVFSRDGVYTTSILHKMGQPGLAEACIDYFLAHPFNGRIYPEADNPGQVLWIMGEHWKFTRDEAWLQRVYPSAMKLAAMIEYYRTTPGPHWVNVASLEFGEALPPEKRQKLEPGRCDGHNPAYTEAFDLAGLRAAAELAKAMNDEGQAALTTQLAEHLAREYDRRFGSNLRDKYGSYCVLWPCRLYDLNAGPGHEQFKGLGAQKPAGWRYFPLATAHQGLLAGNRAAAHGTIDVHLAHEQMRGWYAFDEGGKSGPGGWGHLRTTWDASVAMPHGWAIAELFLLIRDSLLFEDGDRLVLLAGVPEAWFSDERGIRIKDLPTHFGACALTYKPSGDGATLTLGGKADPPGGYRLRLPATFRGQVEADGRKVAAEAGVGYALPRGARVVRLIGKL